VLSKVNTEKASNLLNLLDSKIAGEVVLRLSNPLQVKREALDVLTDTIEREFLAPMRTSSKTRNPGEMIGAMMNNVMSEKREELMGVIETSAPDILKDVKKSMLTFQDIAARVPPNAIPMAIKEIEVQEFLQAMKFGRQNAPSSVEFIFKNISQRMAAQYEEQMEELSTVPVKDAEAAQAAFMTVIRKLAAAGEITLIEVASEEDEDEEETP
jgi:flagellar motor switch protein FliG